MADGSILSQVIATEILSFNPRNAGRYDMAFQRHGETVDVPSRRRLLLPGESICTACLEEPPPNLLIPESRRE
jgi:hypothetical protein